MIPPFRFCPQPLPIVFSMSKTPLDLLDPPKKSIPFMQFVESFFMQKMFRKHCLYSVGFGTKRR